MPRIIITGYKFRRSSGHLFYYSEDQRWNLMNGTERMRDIKNDEPNRYNRLKKFYD